MKNQANIQTRKSRRELAHALMDYFVEHPGEDFSKNDLYNEFKLKNHPSRKVLVDILDDLVMCEYLSVGSGGHYRLLQQQTLTEGTMVRHGGVVGFQPDGEEEVIYVGDRHIGNALDGDRVGASVIFNRKRNRREAEIVNVIKRAKDTFVGVINVEKHFAFLDVNDRYLPWDIFIPKTEIGNARSGDKAVVKIVEWPSKINRSPVGKIVDVLGATGDNNVEMHAILAEFGLPYTYPENLEKLANKISGRITDRELNRRKDFREITTFTIDPRDAKDFDDALSLRRLENGLWEVGVHIADVTHYIKEGSPIDEEAYKRATSVYLVDRTIPMLPERLCNYVCSLRPDEEKLTYSVVFQMNDRAEVKDYEIVRTVIRSNRRFTYEEVQTILEQNGEASAEDLSKPGFHPQRVKPNADGSPVGEYATELIALNRLAKHLKADRMKGGSIEFQRDEVHFEIDENGHPIGTYIKASTDAHKLIEEFMLLANKYVAQRIGMVPKGVKAKVFPYRIHDVPDPEKLSRLSGFVSRFGYSVKVDGSKTEISRSINSMLHKVVGRKEQSVIEELALRSMTKARYSTHNVGHYGLMFRYYTHFTSPIRRYPDQMVHRLLTRYLDGGRSVNQLRCEDQCDHSSEMEQIAANAERASIKYKQVEYMADKLGQEFTGKVSGANDFGVYVELDDSKCEGSVPLRTLLDDHYSYDEKTLSVVGRRSHRRLSIGDPVKIRVVSANLERRQLEFAMVEVNGHAVAY
ncbi:MAG: ribonuclease R [Bacteroidaceae bacterium]|nr:ribonuclease R [Bacteroidaceae bacterium]